jgi:hypothetical protein
VKEEFDPEKAMGHWVARDDDEVVWKIAPGRYVLFRVKYSEPEDERELLEPLLGRELTPSEAKTWFADPRIGHTREEPIEAAAPKVRPEPAPAMATVTVPNQPPGENQHVDSPNEQSIRQQNKPDNAVRCSQNAVVDFLKQAPRGKIIESLAKQGVLQYWYVHTTLWVVFCDPKEHERFKEFMENRGKRGKSWKNVE